MRDEAWYKDVEDSLMILHQKIDQLKVEVVDINEFLDAIAELNAEEEPSGDPGILS